MRAIFIVVMLSSCLIGAAQNDNPQGKRPYFYSYVSIDSVCYYSRKISILYTLKRSDHLKKDFFRKGDAVFNDSINQSSKLYIKNHENRTTKSLSTIPVDNIVIDDSNEIIVCLSRAAASPYHIVLYNFKGELLFKKTILMFELKLDSLNYMEFQNSFPEFYKYAKTHYQISKENGLHFIAPGYWTYLDETQKDAIKESGWLQFSHYFPHLFTTSVDGPPISLRKFTSFYSQTDPFYEFEFQNSKLVAIILNNEYGGKVKIPIILIGSNDMGSDDVSK